MDMKRKAAGAGIASVLMVQGAAAQIQSGVQELWNIGFFKYGAPFLFMFALVYGLTTKLSIFENERVSALVAVTAGQFFGAFAVIASGLLVVVMAAGIGGYDESWAFGDGAKKTFFVLGGLAAITAFIGWGGLQWLKTSAAQTNIGNLGFFSNDVFLFLVLIVLVLALIWWVIEGEEESGEEGPE
ncbi:MAG: hypothetical protein ABEI97_01190 [Candidatus Nanohaloarchaea archaeon]